jgi:hypothetical protein
MTRAGWLEVELVLPPPVLVEVGLEEPPEEQAARPAARSAAATAVRALLLGILLIVNFDLSSRVLRFRGGLSCVAIFDKALCFFG